MDAKIGTKTWSEAPQSSGLRGDGANKVSADLKKKYEGDKSVGDVLNQIADPNFSNKPKREVGKGELGKDDFLKLMLTQMKYQDPMNPMDTQQMASQLAQFTSLEQLHNINTSLEDLKKGQEPMHKYEAINLLGKTISSDSTRITRFENDKNHDMMFTLPDDTAQVKLVVKDANGDAVRTYEAKALKKGENKISWNGLDEKGNKAHAGEYTFAIEATSAAGKKMAVSTAVNGKITGVNYTSSGPVLLVGDKSVRLSEIHRIEDQDLKQAQGKEVTDVTKQALPTSDKKEEDKGKQGAVGKQVQNAVPMSGALMNQVKDKASGSSDSANTKAQAAKTEKKPPMQLNKFNNPVKRG